MNKFFIVVISSIAISGCSGFGYSKPGGTQDEFNSDKMNCTRESAMLYPTTMVDDPVLYQSPTTTNCYRYGNQMNCTTNPGIVMPRTQSDSNSLNRTIHWGSCMRSRGWVWGHTHK